MNPGYLSWLLMLISIILFASGWKDILMSGMDSKVILLFFVSWFVGMQLHLAFPSAKTSIISVGIVILLVRAAISLWRLEGIAYRLHAILLAILVSTISLFMQETVYMLPSLVLGSVELTMAIFTGILVAMAIKLPVVQVAVLSVGLIIGEFYFVYIHKLHVGTELGSLKFLDRWWLHIFVVRGLSILKRYSAIVGKQLLNTFISRVKTNLKKNWQYRKRS